MKKGYLTLLGFAMLTIGFLSILFAMVGLRFTFMKVLNNIGEGFSFLVYVILIFGGIIVMYMSKMTEPQD